MTRTETGSVGLTFEALFPGSVLTCACGCGATPPLDGPGKLPEHATSKKATTSNINTRRMTPRRTFPIATHAQAIAGNRVVPAELPVAPGLAQDGGDSLGGAAAGQRGGVSTGALHQGSVGGEHRQEHLTRHREVPAFSA